MDTNAFRYLFDYHFSENHKVWDGYVTQLPQEQFIQEVNYSHGSIRNQIVHMISTETLWFCELRAVEVPKGLDPADFDDRQKIRSHWDNIEQMMSEYLDGLRDEMLFSKPIVFEDDKDLIVWQVLLHVVNHATDHRAQILRNLNDMGIKTGPQDLIFYIFDHMEK